MAKPLVVPMSPNLIVSGAYTLRVTALSQVDGSTVSGVKVSAGAASVRNLLTDTTAADGAPPNPLLVPTDA